MKKVVIGGIVSSVAEALCLQRDRVVRMAAIR
jgi:hypothetical protein